MTLELTVLHLDDAEAVSVAAAGEFVRAAREAVAAHGRFAVALAGGSTPRRTYQLLAGSPYREQVEWDKVHFFWGDERAVPPDHADSNYRMAHEALLCRLPLDPGQVHRMQADREDREAAALAYEAELARVLAPAPGAPPPSLDLVLLGMGADGHTLSLFPFTAALRETSRWVVANHVPKLNADRVTMTAGLVNAAARVAFLVAGDDKAGPLAEVLEGPPDPDRLPSQLIRPAGRLLWIVDRKAAAGLGRGTPEVM